MDLHTITLEITDPAEWDGSLFGTHLELVQLRGQEFYSKQTVTQLGGVQLLRLSVNQPATVRSKPLSLRFVATIFDAIHEGHFAGAEIDGSVLLMPPAFDFDACVKDSSFQCTSVFAVPELVRAYYRTLTGEDLQDLDSLVIGKDAAKSFNWLGMWNELVDADLENLSHSERARVQESLRDQALSSIVEVLQPKETVDCTSKLARARQLVRVAEEYTNKHLPSAVRMVDLCRAAGVSERTLQYAFQTCLGISPINYLRRHRLHGARRELKAADSSSKTVASIACQYGFFHFGDFSKDYKALFGEFPSATLQKQ